LFELSSQSFVFDTNLRRSFSRYQVNIRSRNDKILKTKHDFNFLVRMSSIKFTKEEASRFIIFPTSAEEKVTFRTIKSGAKKNAYTSMLIEKTFDALGVRIVCDDKSIGKKVTISVFCKCTNPTLFHYQCATEDLQADREIVFRILRKGDECSCGLFDCIQGYIS
jgi:hypothetical protein